MELQKYVWDGRIAACFILADYSQNITSSGEPTPYCTYVPRVSYLATLFDKLRKHFEKFLSNPNEEIWCDFNNEPLKWHYPVGLLYDLTTSESFSGKQRSPWLVRVHFGDYPVNELLRCNLPETIESHYLATLKEADFLVHNKRVVDQFQKRDFKQLWNSFVNEKFDQFWAINRRLHESPTYSSDDAFNSQNATEDASGEKSASTLSLRYFAFRLYVQSAGSQRFRIVQKLVRSTVEKDGKKVRTTLGDVLTSCLPDTPVDCSVGGDRSAPYKVVMHGVQFTDFSVPFEWLAEHLSYPENFLHIAILDYPK